MGSSTHIVTHMTSCREKLHTPFFVDFRGRRKCISDPGNQVFAALDTLTISAMNPVCKHLQDSSMLQKSDDSVIMQWPLLDALAYISDIKRQHSVQHIEREM